MIIEIATSDFESTRSAVAGGADRIELCANLGEGGTTQSYGVIKKCRENFDVKIYPIIRVRGGDFLYTDEEFNCMYEDALLCKGLACDGVVIGFLNKDGSIDINRTAKIIEAVYPLGITFHRAFDRCLDPFEAMEQAVYPLGITFHRAFDRCLDPFEAMEQLIAAGCERILTSGQQRTAPEGIELIRQLNKQAEGRIIIMPGSGVRAGNIRHLAETTRCTEFHTSLRERVTTEMQFMTPAFEGDDENDHFTVKSSAVIDLRNALL